MTRGRLPDTYLIGAPKAGTTALANWLAQHPDVYFSVPKEPYYWAADYPGMRARYGFDTAAAYAGLFAGPAAAAASRRAEGSTTYLYSERAVPDILTACGPDVRFVVALRRPAEMLLSYHRTQIVALNEDEQDFAAAWRRSLQGVGPATTTPVDPKLVDYPLVGRVGAALQRLYGRVARENVHVVLFDDLRTEPARVWVDLTRFLDLPAQPAPDFAVRNASTKTFRSAALRRLTHTPPAVLARPMRALRTWSRTTANPAARTLKGALWRSEQRPAAPPAVLAEVTHHLAADTSLAAALIGRDLSGWASVPVRESTP